VDESEGNVEARRLQTVHFFRLQVLIEERAVADRQRLAVLQPVASNDVYFAI